MTWTASSVDAAVSNSPVKDSTITCTPQAGYPAGVVKSTFPVATACTATACTTGTEGFTGLAAGTFYSCKVEAINEGGSTSVSSASAQLL